MAKLIKPQEGSSLERASQTREDNAVIWVSPCSGSGVILNS